MPEQVKKVFSVAILTTIFTTLVTTIIGASILYAAPKIISVDPLMDSVDRLSKAIIDNQEMNAQQHAELSVMIYEQNARMKGNEAKLFRVVLDCRENHQEIQECKERLNGNSRL